MHRTGYSAEPAVASVLTLADSALPPRRCRLVRILHFGRGLCSTTDSGSPHQISIGPARLTSDRGNRASHKLPRVSGAGSPSNPMAWTRPSSLLNWNGRSGDDNHQFAEVRDRDRQAGSCVGPARSLKSHRLSGGGHEGKANRAGGRLGSFRAVDAVDHQWRTRSNGAVDLCAVDPQLQSHVRCFGRCR